MKLSPDTLVISKDTYNMLIVKKPIFITVIEKYLNKNYPTKGECNDANQLKRN